jgi:hypothetical protein
MTALMSGALSVFREVYGLYSGVVPARSLFWSCMYLAFVISATVLWMLEHKALLEEKGKNQVPDFGGEINAAFICPDAIRSFQGNLLPLPHDSFILLQVVAWNKRNMNPASVHRYLLSLEVNGKTYDGEFRWTPEQSKMHTFILEGHTDDAPQFTIQIGSGLGDLCYLSKRSGNLLFRVPGLSALNELVAEIKLTLIDLTGNPHSIGATQYPLTNGRLLVYG